MKIKILPYEMAISRAARIDPIAVMLPELCSIIALLFERPYWDVMEDLKKEGLHSWNKAGKAGEDNV